MKSCFLKSIGYFIWAAQSAYKHVKDLEQQWEDIIHEQQRKCEPLRWVHAPFTAGKNAGEQA